MRGYIFLLHHERRKTERWRSFGEVRSQIPILANKDLCGRTQAGQRAATIAKQKIGGLSKRGTSIFGALFGNKVSTRTRATKAASAVKNIGKATAASGDLARAEQTLDELVSMQQALELELENDIEQLASQFAPQNLEIEQIEIPLRKADTKIGLVALGWIPWQMSQDGRSTPLVSF